MRRTAMSNSAIWVSKMSRNRPEMRKVTSMRGRSSAASGRISMPVTRLEAVSQVGPHAEIGQRLGEIVAAGAQRGRRPEVDDQCARGLAMILQVTAHDFVGRAHADRRRGAGRNGARIDRGEIAPARQHVGAAARRRAGGARRHAASVERGEEGSAARGRRRPGRPPLFRVANASACTVASSGVRPKTCRPSRMLRSLMSQSWASSLAMAGRLGSPLSSPQSAASPLFQARSTISSSRKLSRRAVEAVGLGIFLDDALQLGQRRRASRRR